MKVNIKGSVLWVFSLLVSLMTPLLLFAQKTPTTQKAAEHDAKIQPLIQAARSEGQLKLMWTPETAGGIEGINQWAKGFNKYYGLNLNIQFTPGPPMAPMGARIIQEYQAKRPSSTDIYLSGANDLIPAVQADALEAVDWSNWAPNIQNPNLIGHGGKVVAFTAPIVGIAYNSTKLTGNAIPTSMQDLLQPRYKGRIASTAGAFLFERLASPEIWGEERTMKYINQFVYQLGGLMGCSAYERIVSGEYDVLAIACNLGQARQWQSRGAPVAAAIASDAPMIQYWYMGVPKTTPSPNAAKLWINYMLTREAQEILYQFSFTDHPLVEGSKTGRELKELEARGIKPIPVGVEFTQRNDLKKLRDVSVKIQRIFAEKK